MISVWLLVALSPTVPKFNAAGAKVRAGETTPVPLMGTVCGDPVALSVTVNSAERGPAAVGWKLI